MLGGNVLMELTDFALATLGCQISAKEIRKVISLTEGRLDLLCYVLDSWHQ